MRKDWLCRWHTLILVCICISCFGALGTWTFGAYRDEFLDFDTSLQSLFSLMFGKGSHTRLLMNECVAGKVSWKFSESSLLTTRCARFRCT